MQYYSEELREFAEMEYGSQDSDIITYRYPYALHQCVKAGAQGIDPADLLEKLTGINDLTKTLLKQAAVEYLQGKRSIPACSTQYAKLIAINKLCFPGAILRLEKISREETVNKWTFGIPAQIPNRYIPNSEIFRNELLSEWQIIRPKKFQICLYPDQYMRIQIPGYSIPFFEHSPQELDELFAMQLKAFNIKQTGWEPKLVEEKFKPLTHPPKGMKKKR